MTYEPLPPHPQPFCAESTEFHGLTVDLMFDHQTEVDFFVEGLVSEGGALALIEKLRVSYYIGRVTSLQGCGPRKPGYPLCFGC